MKLKISLNTGFFFLKAIAFLLAYMPGPLIAEAQTRDKSLMVIKAADELSVLSQSVVKNYFYIARGFNVTQASAHIKKHQKKIDKNLAFLRVNIKNQEIKSIIDFMESTRDEMRKLVSEPFSENNAYLIMDMSEVLLEGGESIKLVLKKSITADHRMLDLVENQLYLIERMAKIYIAAQLGIYDFNSKKQMQKAIADFDVGLSKISKYNYAENHLSKVVKVKKHWKTSRHFYQNAENGSLPRTVFLATQLMVYPLSSLAEYHSQH